MSVQTSIDEDSEVRLVLSQSKSTSALVTPLVFSGPPLVLPTGLETLDTICRILLTVEISLIPDYTDLDPKLLKFRQEALEFFGPSLYNELLYTISVYTLTLGVALAEVGLRNQYQGFDPSQFN